MNDGRGNASRTQHLCLPLLSFLHEESVILYVCTLNRFLYTIIYSEHDVSYNYLYKYKLTQCLACYFRGIYYFINATRVCLKMLKSHPHISLVPRLSKGGGGKESLVHTVCACVKLCTRLARAMTFYDVLVTFDRMLTSALIDF